MKIFVEEYPKEKTDCPFYYIKDGTCQIKNGIKCYAFKDFYQDKNNSYILKNCGVLKKIDIKGVIK
ncbi:MAG: hypothetical protein IJ094_13005 [Bacilli bacterium]|nr:hypothetical protein [Bacilli bacterium]